MKAIYEQYDEMLRENDELRSRIAELEAEVAKQRAIVEAAEAGRLGTVPGAAIDLLKAIAKDNDLSRRLGMECGVLQAALQDWYYR